MHYLIIAVLAFGLSLMGCEGKTGPAGPSGSTGAAGPAGPAGPQGSTGPQGATGPEGPEGPQGEAGPAGAQGEKGDTGAQGEKGDTGAQGEKGDTGAQGEKGDTGAQGEKGDTGAQGEKGDTGEQGEQGPEGPMGPAGVPDTGGLDPIELAQAHHIAFVIDDADPKENPKITLRVDEESMVSAVAGAQSGRKLPSITETVTMEITKDENDAVTLEDGVLTAVGAGTAEITAESVIAGISGKLTVTVTNPIDKIVFMVGSGDGATEADSEFFLAASESTDEITAVAHDEDGDVVAPRSDWVWESSDKSVATVKQRTEKKDGKDVLVMKGAHGTITGAGTGSTSIIVTSEGVSGSIDVTVTGQRVTRSIEASNSNNGNTFTWDRGRVDPDDENSFEAGFTGDTASNDATTASTEFDVDLYDAISGERLDFQAVGDITITNNNSTSSAVIVGTPTLAGGTLTVTVSAPDGSSVINGNPQIVKGTHQSILTIRTTGADPIKLRFTLVVKDAPTAQ